MAEKILEDDVARRLGIDRAAVRALREELLDEADVVKGPRGSIAYTATGLEKIAAAARERLGGAEMPAPVPEAAGTQPDGQGGAMETLTETPLRRVKAVVVLVPRVTAKRLIVRTGTQEFIVHVRDNRMFLPGMELECEVQGRVGYFHGRLPRRKGRW